jgi:predicted nuclease of predicted toxin-antitoxin system
MRFLLDESADARIATYLQSLGHDCTTVAVDHIRSLDDADVLAIAHREGRVLVTDDRDFGELVFREGRPHSGVIYLRLGITTRQFRLERLAHVLAHHADELRRFMVVTRDEVRVR